MNLRYTFYLSKRSEITLMCFPAVDLSEQRVFHWKGGVLEFGERIPVTLVSCDGCLISLFRISDFLKIKQIPSACNILRKRCPWVRDFGRKQAKSFTLRLTGTK